MSQQELTFIAEFLRGFDKTDSTATGRKGVNLEKLGQYLRREPLQTCLTAEGSEWAAILTENKCLHDHPLIVKQDLDSSLLQSHEKLVNAIDQVFSEAYQSLVSHFSVTSIALPSSQSTRDTQIVASDENLLIAASDPERKLLRLFKIETTCSETRKLNFKRSLVCIDSRNGSFFQLFIIFYIFDNYKRKFTLQRSRHLYAERCSYSKLHGGNLQVFNVMDGNLKINDKTIIETLKQNTNQMLKWE